MKANRNSYKLFPFVNMDEKHGSVPIHSTYCTQNSQNSTNMESNDLRKLLVSEDLKFMFKKLCVKSLKPGGALGHTLQKMSQIYYDSIYESH